MERKQCISCFSDHLHFWDEPIIIQEPRHSLGNSFRLGNCGISPLELDEGWLVLNPWGRAMRQYFMGAILRYLEESNENHFPTGGALGCTPKREEREGYVPNVFYSLRSHDP